MRPRGRGGRNPPSRTESRLRSSPTLESPVVPPTVSDESVLRLQGVRRGQGRFHPVLQDRGDPVRPVPDTSNSRLPLFKRPVHRYPSPVPNRTGCLYQKRQLATKDRFTSKGKLISKRRSTVTNGIMGLSSRRKEGRLEDET